MHKRKQAYFLQNALFHIHRSPQAAVTYSDILCTNTHYIYIPYIYTDSSSYQKGLENVFIYVYLNYVYFIHAPCIQIDVKSVKQVSSSMLGAPASTKAEIN